MKTRKNNSGSGFTLIEVIITIVVVAIVAAMMASYFGTSITQSSLPIFRLNATASLNEILEKITAQYSQNPQWQKNTAYALNTIILPTTQERTGLLYKVTTAGTSGAAQPDWSTKITDGSTIADNTIIWTTVWPTATPPDVAAPTLALNGWLPGKPYTTSPVSIVYANSGASIGQYICIIGGTSGLSAPTWPTTSGATVSDGGVTWQYIGLAPTLVLQTYIGAEGADVIKTFPGDSLSSSYHVIHNKFIRFDTTNNPATESEDFTGVYAGDYGKYLKVTISLPSNPAGESLTTLFVLR